MITEGSLFIIREIVNRRTSVNKEDSFGIMLAGKLQRFVGVAFPPRRGRDMVVGKEVTTQFKVAKELKIRTASGKFFMDCVIANVFVTTKEDIVIQSKTFSGSGDKINLIKAVAEFPPLANLDCEVFLISLREFFGGDNLTTLRLMALLSCYGVCYMETQIGIGGYMSKERAISEGLIAIKKNRDDTFKLGMFGVAP